MICPICGADTKVVDSRWKEENNVIRRKRQCVKCDYHYITLEVEGNDIEYINNKVTKENSLVGESVDKAIKRLENALNELDYLQREVLHERRSY